MHGGDSDLVSEIFGTKCESKTINVDRDRRILYFSCNTIFTIMSWCSG